VTPRRGPNAPCNWHPRAGRRRHGGEIAHPRFNMLYRDINNSTREPADRASNLVGGLHGAAGYLPQAPIPMAPRRGRRGTGVAFRVAFSPWANGRSAPGERSCITPRPRGVSAARCERVACATLACLGSGLRSGLEALWLLFRARFSPSLCATLGPGIPLENSRGSSFYVRLLLYLYLFFCSVVCFPATPVGSRP
jgi:hypothetical protein